MNSDNILVLALKNTVTAMSKHDGQMLWSNELKGYRYGIASLCFPGGPSAPDAAAIKNQVLKRPQQTSATAGLH